MHSQVHAAEWHARLELGFERRGASTVLVSNRHVGPLQVQKVLYPEDRLTCHAAVLHPPGGIAARDRLELHVTLADQARVVLTTPGATKWYRCAGEWARQDVRVVLHDDAVLEWLPRESIVFDGSCAAATIEVAMSARAQYFGWDIVSFGRRASGERWAQGRLHLSNRIRCEGRTLWSEVANVDAGSHFQTSATGLNGCSVCGTFVVVGRDVAPELLAACRAQPLRDGGSAGVTCLPQVLIARYLGHSTEAAFAWFVALWQLLRPELTSRAACAPRIWAC